MRRTQVWRILVVCAVPGTAALAGRAAPALKEPCRGLMTRQDDKLERISSSG